MSRFFDQPWPANQIGCSPTIRSTYERRRSADVAYCHASRLLSGAVGVIPVGVKTMMPKRFVDPTAPVRNFNMTPLGKPNIGQNQASPDVIFFNPAGGERLPTS